MRRVVIVERRSAHEADCLCKGLPVAQSAVPDDLRGTRVVDSHGRPLRVYLMPFCGLFTCSLPIFAERNATGEPKPAAYLNIAHPFRGESAVPAQSLKRLVEGDKKLLHAIAERVQRRTHSSDEEWPRHTIGLDVLHGFAANAVGKGDDLARRLAALGFDGITYQADSGGYGRCWMPFHEIQVISLDGRGQ